MSNQTPEQLAEQAINDNFGNRLTPEEQHLAVQIAKEIYISPLEQNLPFDEWQERVTQFEQDFQTRLRQAETAQQRATLRFASLWLQDSAQEAARKIFANPQESLTYLKRGLAHAEDFLTQGETAAGVREQVLKLYNNAGFTLGAAPFLDAEQALTTYQRGLKHAEDFLNQGETTAGVRDPVLRLYVNAGVTLGAAPFLDAEQALITYQRGLKHAEDFLTQGETATGVRELVLRLYHNAGLTLGATPFLDAEQALKTYQRGLKHAEDFLTQGETATEVLDWMQGLYDNRLTILFNRGQIEQVLPYLPLTNYLLWQVASHFAPEKWQIPLDNLKIRLSYIDFPIRFSPYFQDFLHHLLTQWHDSERGHRHLTAIRLDNQILTPTDILLRVSEGGYVLAEAMDRHWLQQAYLQVSIADNPTYLAQWQQDIGKPLELALQTAKQLWDPFFPQTPLAIEAPNIPQCQLQLEALPWYKTWLARRKRKSLQIALAQCQSLLEQDMALKMQWRWARTLSDAQQAQVNWLQAGVLHFLPLPEGLPNAAAIVLAVVFISLKQNIVALINWLAGEPWSEALSQSGLLAWAETADKTLWDWWQKSESAWIRGELLIPIPVLAQEHTGLREALQAWQTGDTATLQNYLQTAWQSAQQLAEPLARLLTALENPTLTTRLDVIVKTGETNATDRQRALTAILCGKGLATLENAITIWIEQQGRVRCLNMSHAVLHLKRGFQAVARVYPKQSAHSTNWSEQVNAWAKVFLTEVLASEQAPHSLWDILERSRIGLASLTTRINLPVWQEKTGELLQQAFEETLQIIQQGEGRHDPQLPWLPLITWLKQLKQWIPPPPSIEECQTYLASQASALLQPFFDPIQQRLRVLWLDQNQLIIRDLPDECAWQSLWTETAEEGIIAQWNRGLEQLRPKAEETRGQVVTQPPDWETVITSTPVTGLAQVFHDWATHQSLQQLIVIFPAPLGQLPWEALPKLENILVRAISTRHWLQAIDKEKTPSPKTAKTVIYDPSGIAQCMVKEARWLTQRWQQIEPFEQIEQQLEAGTSVLETLHQLAQSNRAHLATHGMFHRQDPTASYLTLQDKQGIHLPLWMISAVRISADLVFLSACVSNLNGQDTEGLLTPIGIGPTFAAAGAKTVIGTLWPYDGLAACCFSYFFYTIATQQPNSSWHQIATQARHALRNMTTSELTKIAEQIGLHNPQDDECSFYTYRCEYAKTVGERPFEKYVYWAGFTVLG